MRQRPVVPQFGNWDTEDNVPYTVFFEKARKGKNGGKMINPNDPVQNPGMFPPSAQVAPSTARNVPKEPASRKSVRPKTLNIQSNSDNSGRRKFTEGPLRNDNVTVSRQRGSGSTIQNRVGNGSGSGRPRRQNAGPEHSVDQSPLDPQYQAKLVGKGSGSSWESRHSNDRSRMNAVSAGIESPDKGAAVPRFGEWDENNPSSADNITQKFNKVRQERNSSTPMASNTNTGQAYANRRMQIDYNKNKSSWSSCFPCFRKSGART
ncbi:RPM1-interacting protein 4-like [Apium graveolens]|uniref:RPM1-interacting protein 4-like n=1 Tax=Apium graveolens TaxID=4045 RepID=UPI003D7B8B8F